MDIHETTHFLNRKYSGRFIDWFKSVRVILVDIAKKIKKKYIIQNCFFYSIKFENGGSDKMYLLTDS